jgi:hypothetical protein
MTSQKFSDVALTEEDLLEIEVKIREVERTKYAGEMPTHNKQVLRKMLVKEMKEAIWADRDYVYGQDEGEPPKEAKW